VEAGTLAKGISKPESKVKTAGNCLTAAGTLFKNLKGQQERSFSSRV
jgi:hypothetical protein